MGALCGPGMLCDLDRSAPSGGYGSRSAMNPSWSSYAAAQAQTLNSDEASRKLDQLGLELRMLRDDNYRIREEQLRLEKELREAGGGSGHSNGRNGAPFGPAGGGYGGYAAGGSSHSGGLPRGASAGAVSTGSAFGHNVLQPLAPPAAGSRTFALGSDSGRARGGLPSTSSHTNPRVDTEQQLQYMQELIRSLQAENVRLRTASRPSSAGGNSVVGLGACRSNAQAAAAASGVSEDQYRQLQRRLKSLQQSHLQHIQQGRQLQARVSNPASAAASASASAAASGTATPLSSTPLWQGGGQDGRVLQAQYEALLREQEALRGKVRLLARNNE